MLLTAFAGFQFASCDMLPTRKMFCEYEDHQLIARREATKKLTSPKVVVAVTEKFTVTVPLPGFPPPPFPPEPLEPVWIAIALLAGTVALNEPPETVNLGRSASKLLCAIVEDYRTYDEPEQLFPEDAPLMTSQ